MELHELIQKTQESGIRMYPEEVLTQKCSPIGNIETHEKLIEDMKKACDAVKGVGLCAPQIGVPLQLAVLLESENNYFVFWNVEEWLPLGGSKRMREGCLSMPSIFGDVTRAKQVILKAHSYDGPFERKFTGLLAQAVQHECAHMDGEMFFEYSKPAEKKFVLAAWKEFQEKYLAGNKKENAGKRPVG